VSLEGMNVAGTNKVQFPFNLGFDYVAYSYLSASALYAPEVC
jgi:hypothetical protein